MHLRRPSAGIFWRFAMNEFWNSAALVVLGALIGVGGDAVDVALGVSDAEFDDLFVCH